MFKQKVFPYFVESLLGCSLNYRLTSWLVVNLNIPKNKQFFFFGVLDTDTKFTAGFIDTGGKLPPASLTAGPNLLPITTINVNLGRNVVT
jgi:hypothetical protein